MEKRNKIVTNTDQLKTLCTNKSTIHQKYIILYLVAHIDVQTRMLQN